MSLDEIANVIMPESGRYKFVLAEINKGNESKYVFVAGPGEYHADIARNFRQELKEQGANLRYVNGGGRVQISEDKIHAFGYSGSYGKCPQDVVEGLLKEYVSNERPNTELKVEIGVGY